MTTNIDSFDNYSYTKLMWATKKNSRHEIDSLLASNANPFIENGYNLCAFIIAIREQNSELVRKFLEIANCNNIKDSSELYYTIARGILDKDLNLILSEKALRICFIEACLTSDRTGKNAKDLIELAKSTHIGTVMYSPISCYVNEDYVEDKITGEWLAEKILTTVNINNVNDKNKYGDTYLMRACMYELFDVVKFLLELGADPLTALYPAALEGNLDVMKLLEKYTNGVDFNYVMNENDCTLIHAAAYSIIKGKYGGWKVIEWLLAEKEVNPFVVNDCAKTARDILVDFEDMYDDLLEKLGCYTGDDI